MKTLLLSLALVAPWNPVSTTGLAVAAGRIQDRGTPSAAVAGEAVGARIERRLSVMGTLLTLEVEHASRVEALQASEAAVRALEEVEARLSTWNDESELSRLNRAPVGQSFPLSAELAHDLERAEHWTRATEGCFDAGIGHLVGAWDLRGDGRVPAEDEIEGLLEQTGLRFLDRSANSAVRSRDMRIEEGAFGKGVGLDAALAALRSMGASRAVLDLGGQVALFGFDGVQPVAGASESRGTLFELADPRERGRAVLEVTLPGGSLATSSARERGIVVDGVRHSHVLDPRTGRPAPDFGSVSVWAESATAADCLSTALLVMGPERAIRWASRQRGVEALVIEVIEDQLSVTLTDGLRSRVRRSAGVGDLTLIPPTTQVR